MASLVEHYAKLFAYGLDIEEKMSAAEGPSVSAEQVRDELLRALQAAEANAQQDNKRPLDIEKASFALVAWLDECLARHPQWLGQVTLLQKTLHNTMNAGDLFFDYLQELTEQQDEVREVYYMAMGLGFVGKYYYDTGERGELVRLKETHGRQLPHPPAAILKLPEEHITPQPYLTQSPGPPRTYIHWDKLLFRGGVLVAILAPLLVLYIYRDREPPEPEQEVERTVPPDSISLQDIEQQWADFKCYRLQADIIDNNQVSLAGYLSADSDKRKLIDRVRQVPGVEAVDADAVEVHVWPYCEVIEILSDYKKRNADQRLGLNITPYQHGRDFTEGEYLLLEMTAPNYPAHVYVDYYDLQGNVVHILPNPTDEQNSLAAGNRKLLGKRDPGKRHYKITGPRFGEQMITIMAAPAPLFPEGRKELEDASSYLTELRNMLRVIDEKFVANYFFIETSNR